MHWEKEGAYTGEYFSSNAAGAGDKIRDMVIPNGLFGEVTDGPEKGGCCFFTAFPYSLHRKLGSIQ